MRTAPVMRAAWWSLLLAIPALFVSPALADPKLESALDGMKNAGYAFSVLVSRDGNVILERGYGFADSARQCPAGESTLYNIASINKSFTAIAAFQLRHQGRLRFEEKLPAFFRDVPADKRSITVEHLLTHTSGLPQRYASEGMETRDDAVGAILADTLGSAPGAAFSYSNENYDLLAAIIEVRSAMAYEQYVRANILAPAGMQDTRFWVDVPPRAGCPVASVLQEPGSRGTRDWGYMGSGGIYASVADLQRWFLALANGTLLRSDDLAAMWEPRSNAGAPAIARGWFISQTRGEKEIWTRGNESWGHNAVLRWFPGRRLLVIVATNSGELGDRHTTANRLVSDRIVETMLEGGTVR
ncbi:MAG TPA: serine hydrolase domain-containing protein [Candidatus Krumholzibacteria bacterium]